MKGTMIVKGFIGILFIAGVPQLAVAKNGSPVCHVIFNSIAINQIQKDTLPPPKKNTDNNNNTSGAGVANTPPADIIKEVPKARRQTIPVPVKVNVKPVKVIKPIIKPVIRILH